MQITGLGNNREVDHFELKEIGENFIKRGMGMQISFYSFGGGVAVNSEGKVIGFPVWAHASFSCNDRICLIKVTPKLRKMFSENTAEARESNQKKLAPGSGSSCESSLEEFL